MRAGEAAAQRVSYKLKKKAVAERERRLVSLDGARNAL
jgi:hypothetical protein